MSPTPPIQCPTPVLPPGAQGLARIAVDDAQARLIVTFQRPVTPAQQPYLLDPDSYSLTGGQRLFPKVLTASIGFLSPPAAPDQVILQLDQIGDFSLYTLTVTAPGVDPFFASRKLRFRLACDDRFDCRPLAPAIPPAPEIPVHIDYLAKDYAGFRQALLDFIPTRLPTWTERSEADIGMVILELLAATADTLSYHQDRVANEAFLETASERRSVASHLALIGYQMDEGASAHTWLFFEVSEPRTLTSATRIAVSNRPRTATEPLIVFETHGGARLDPRHTRMAIYSWGNQNCCLPASATEATLEGDFSGLRAGDYLLFDDTQGRCDIVRLTENARLSLGDGSPVTPTLTVVTWSAATPLGSDYCVGHTVVRGNLVRATHGESVVEPLRSLTLEQQAEIEAQIAARKPGQSPPRQRLRLSRAPLARIDTSVAAYAGESSSTISLEVEGIAGVWLERTSLLDSQPSDTVFRVEVEDDGQATVVFGDGVFGMRPAETASVTASYRVGGGSAGNVGANTLIEPRASLPWLVSVTNPVPAVGGRNLESSAHARRFGPPSFQKSLVAVTAGDYQSAAQALRDTAGQLAIQRAKAEFHWTGSWLTVMLAVDPASGLNLDESLKARLLADLEMRRLAGYDLNISGAVYVPVDLAIEFCPLPGFLDADVRQRLLARFGTGVLPGGAKAFFHPDSFSFGDGVVVSRVYEAAMSVAGVKAARITRLSRLRSARPERETAINLAQGLLSVAPNQIVRLDNDRNFPENGVISIQHAGVRR